MYTNFRFFKAVPRIYINILTVFNLKQINETRRRSRSWLFSNVQNFKEGDIPWRGRKRNGEGSEERVGFFFWDEHDSIMKGCIYSSRLSVFVSKRSRQTCLSHFTLCCFLPRSPVPEMRRIYSRDWTANARKAAEKKGAKRERVNRKGNRKVAAKRRRRFSTTKLRINDKVASNYSSVWKKSIFFFFFFISDIYWIFAKSSGILEEIRREEAKDEEVKIWNEVKVCHSRASPGENFVSNVGETRRGRRKKSWKKNRYLGTDSARGKRVRKGKFCLKLLSSLSLSRVRFRAPRAKSEGLAGYGSRLLRC